MGLEEKEKRLEVHTAQRRPQRPQRTRKKIGPGARRPAGVRVLIRTALCCALMLGAMALSALDTPWSRRALDAARSAMTMRVDVAGSLSRLAFVRELFPETALVFWNLGEEDLYLTPVSGPVETAFSPQRPYTEFTCRAGETVRSAATGTVESVKRGVNGQWIVTLSHAGGAQTRYAYLSETPLAPGDAVLSGAEMGKAAGDYVFFQLLVDGQEADPGDFRAGQFQ